MKNCKHHYVRGDTEWINKGLWKYLIMFLYCEKCGEVKQKELARK